MNGVLPPAASSLDGAAISLGGAASSLGGAVRGASYLLLGCVEEGVEPASITGGDPKEDISFDGLIESS